MQPFCSHLPATCSCRAKAQKRKEKRRGPDATQPTSSKRRADLAAQPAGVYSVAWLGRSVRGLARRRLILILKLLLMLLLLLLAVMRKLGWPMVGGEWTCSHGHCPGPLQATKY